MIKTNKKYLIALLAGSTFTGAGLYGQTAYDTGTQDPAIATNASDITTNATDIATNASDIATNQTDIAT
ncbi:MAG: hypothetical protein ACO3N7_09005, partial [Kiritimatiellia bacterium]